MNNNKNFYLENKDRVIVEDKRFDHLMALSLNSKSDYNEGVIRAILSRDGRVDKKGYIDRSELYKIEKNDAGLYEIKESLNIKNSKEIIDSLSYENLDFLGLEDPDIWIDEENNLIHLYFTIPFLDKENDNFMVYLGHAKGKNLDNLRMTAPVLADTGKYGAKELAIAPLNKEGIRYNLVESSDHGKDFWYSTIRVAIAEDMCKDWKFGEILFHPKENNIAWAGEHASPGPLLGSDFIDMGEGRCLGFMNGRGSNQEEKDKYGKFSIGLFIYNYEKALIEWVSPEEFISDSQAKTITFASQFVADKNGKGILYAHIDDSFIRSYDITADNLRRFIEQYV